MRTFPTLLLLFFTISVSYGCYDANWWAVLDKANVWATCNYNSKDKYIRGFWRVSNAGANDIVGRLELARCCGPPDSYTSLEAECVTANWWGSLDKNNQWSICPGGYYLHGIYKTADRWLHNIEEGRCCKPKGHPNDWGKCYDHNVGISFDNKGWSECNAGYYLVGLYRGGCDRLYCIEKFKCCQIEEHVEVCDG